MNIPKNIIHIKRSEEIVAAGLVYKAIRQHELFIALRDALSKDWDVREVMHEGDKTYIKIEIAEG